jgi:hypothetical protein
MKRGEMIRIIIDMAWCSLSEDESNMLLDHYKLTETDIQEFLYAGQRAINDIDEQFASEKPA